jgi:hypothetical protein
MFRRGHRAFQRFRKSPVPAHGDQPRGAVLNGRARQLAGVPGAFRNDADGIRQEPQRLLFKGRPDARRAPVPGGGIKDEQGGRLCHRKK